MLILVLIYRKTMFMFFIGKHRTQLNLNIESVLLPNFPKLSGIQQVKGKQETKFAHKQMSGRPCLFTICVSCSQRTTMNLVRRQYEIVMMIENSKL